MNPSPITQLRYAQMPQLSGARLLQANYYKEFINVYGVTGTYYKSDAYDDYFPVTPYNSNLSSNYIYGEQYPLTYVSSAILPFHLQMNADAFILNQYGVNPDQQATITFMINEFNLAFPTTRTTNTLIYDMDFYVPIISSEVSGNAIYFTHTESSNNLILTVSAAVPSGLVYINDYDPSAYMASGYIDISGISAEILSGVQKINISEDTRFYQPLQYSDNYEQLRIYTQNLNVQYCSGFLVSAVSSNVYGTLTGHLTGTITFNSLSDFNDFKARVTPLPGDYIRMPFFDDNNEEWEITNVNDRNLTNEGINPFMDKYVWSCDVVRRRYSHEDNKKSDIDMEDSVSGNIDILSGQSDNLSGASDGIFDYGTDYTSNVDGKTNIDRIYGGY